MKQRFTKLTAGFAMLLFAMAAPKLTTAQQQVSYFFAAHADDWQLFMGTAAKNDVLSGAKVVFVTLTAGDAGLGAAAGVGTLPYFQARENGSVKSAKFLGDYGSDGSTVTSSNRKVNGHKIIRYEYKNTVSYFLRLPDGNLDGSGFAGTGNQSLQKFRTGMISSMTAVDGSTTYTSWNDLKKTLRNIIINEKGSDDQVYINTPDIDETINPGDHSDHLNTARAAQEATSSLSWVGIAAYEDYVTGSKATNLGVDDIELEGALHAMDGLGLSDAGYGNNWEPGHNSWLDKQYFRVAKTPTGSGLLASAISSEDALKISAQPDNNFIKRIYPSPITKGITSFKVDAELAKPGNIKIYLMNNKGVTMQTFEQNVSGKATITVPLKANFTPGLYTVTFLLDDKMKQSQNIIVQ